MFADIILPLPLDGYFTYSVPQQLEEQMRVGVRVLVPFGRSKTYVGLTARLHDNAPADYKVKDVLRVLDSEPILLPQQLKLWQWISDYYMSPIGEVYKAALPAGMKNEEGYRPKTETYIRLTPPYRTEQALHAALDMLVRAPKQLAVFNEFLSLSDFLSCLEVSRDELLNASQANVETIKALVTRGLLETYEVEVGRLNHGGGEPHPENGQAADGGPGDSLQRYPPVHDEAPGNAAPWRHLQRKDRDIHPPHTA